MQNRRDNEGDIIRHMLGVSKDTDTRAVVTEIAERAYKVLLADAMARVAEHDARLAEHDVHGGLAYVGRLRAELEDITAGLEAWRQVNYDLGALLGLSGSFHRDEVKPALQAKLTALEVAQAELAGVKAELASLHKRKE